MRLRLYSVALGMLLTAFASADQTETPFLALEVIDPYADVRSGPGRGYPVFYVIEQGEVIDVLTRRPGWYRIRAANGRTGWASAAQISRTLQTTGEPADLPSVGYGDYVSSRWRIGFTAGQFTGGELADSETFSGLLGYRPLEWLGVELELGTLYGSDVKGEFYGLNALVEPFSQWRLSPLLTLGAGQLSVDSQPKLIPLSIGDEPFQHYGVGFNFYLGRNFVLRGEFRQLNLDLETNDEKLDVWKLGFNTFF